MEKKKRLIDADALKAVFDERYDNAFMQSHTRPNIAYWEGYSSGVNWGRNTIADAPTVDAVEVVHGRWDKNWSGDNIVYCNQCYMPQDVPTPYCASCGAKMDE